MNGYIFPIQPIPMFSNSFMSENFDSHGYWISRRGKTGPKGGLGYHFPVCWIFALVKLKGGFLTFYVY